MENEQLSRKDTMECQENGTVETSQMEVDDEEEICLDIEGRETLDDKQLEFQKSDTTSETENEEGKVMCNIMKDNIMKNNVMTLTF